MLGKRIKGVALHLRGMKRKNFITVCFFRCLLVLIAGNAWGDHAILPSDKLSIDQWVKKEMRLAQLKEAEGEFPNCRDTLVSAEYSFGLPLRMGRGENSIDMVVEYLPRTQFLIVSYKSTSTNSLGVQSLQRLLKQVPGPNILHQLNRRADGADTHRSGLYLFVRARTESISGHWHQHQFYLGHDKKFAQLLELSGYAQSSLSVVSQDPSQVVIRALEQLQGPAGARYFSSVD